MELNIHLNINITFKQENQQPANAENHTSQIREEPIKSVIVTKRHRRKSSFHMTIAKYRRVQEKVNEIAKSTKGLTKTALIARAARTVKAPVNFSRIYEHIVFPSDYPYFKGRRVLTEENCKDMAALIVGGAGQNSAIMAVEACTDFSCAMITKFKRSVTQKDVERVKEKYKDILMLYGVYDHVVYDKKLAHVPVSARSKMTREERAYHRSNRMKFTHDQVCKMVSAYESLPVSSEASLESDMKCMCNKFGINCTKTIQRILFAHTGVPGYEDIPIPEVRNISIVSDKVNIPMVEEVRYLRDVKRFGVQKIANITGLSYDFVRRAYNAVIRPDIRVSPEMRQIFDERYAKTK